MDAVETKDLPPATTAERGAKAGLLALIFSLGFMQPALSTHGMQVVATDVLAVLLAAAWLALLAFRRRRRRWHWSFWVLLAYCSVLALSALTSAEPSRSAFKLVTEAYLVGLPVLTFNLIDDEEDLRRACLAWLVASLVVGLVLIVALLSYSIAPGSLLSRLLEFNLGTLPPGSYPRFRLTFVNANMLCNYLTVALLIALAAAHSGWIGRRRLLLLLAAILASALFTISPGLGGILLALGAWAWLLIGSRAPARARLALLAGIGAAVVFVAATAITPFLHPTAPYLIHVGNIVVAPAARLMTWTDAARHFLAHPLLGSGIGTDAAHVFYVTPSGEPQRLTDAHNTFLSLAAQCGILGLAGIVAMLCAVARLAQPLRLEPGPAAVRTALGLAVLIGLGYEGLGGSFEDARHLWVALGLLIAAARLSRPVQRG